jgi:hypothetical protein
MKKKLISLIKILGITQDEVIIDIDILETTFNTIEWRRKGNQVILHKFLEGDIEIEFNYDELPKKMKKEIYLFLLRETLN